MMRPKKILILTNMYPSDEKPSAGIFVINQYKYLKQCDKYNEYHILGMDRQFTNFSKSVKKYILFSRKIVTQIRKNRYDLIHLHYFFPLLPIVYLFKYNKTKVIITVHGSDFYEKMNNALTKKIYKYFLKKCNYIICVGGDLKSDFEKQLKVNVNEVLSAGVDDKIFFSTNAEKKYDFLFVGSLIDRKGFDVVLNTIESSIQLGYTWCVVGLGFKKYEARLKEIVETNSNLVEYFPALNQTELNLNYNQSKWFFFPSRNEPFGLVASESIFAGTPVITTQSGGLKEQVIENVNGFFLDSINDKQRVLQLVIKAHNLNDYEYSSLRKNCSSVNSKFSLQYVCSRLIKIYNSL